MNNSRIKQTAKCIVGSAVLSLALCLPMSANAEVVVGVVTTDGSRISCIDNELKTEVSPDPCAKECVANTTSVPGNIIKCLKSCAEMSTISCSLLSE